MAGNERHTGRVIRIKHYEEIYDEVRSVVNELREAIERFDNAVPGINDLEDYYRNGLWKRDYTADDNGKLTSDLKRGVLSQDGLFDLLAEVDDIKKRLSDAGNEDER